MIRAGSNEEIAAAELGIDAVINIVGEGHDQNIVVFDRSALVMPDYGLTYTPKNKPPRPETAPEPVRPKTVKFRDEDSEDVL